MLSDCNGGGCNLSNFSLARGGQKRDKNKKQYRCTENLKAKKINSFTMNSKL